LGLVSGLGAGFRVLMKQWDKHTIRQSRPRKILSSIPTGQPSKSSSSMAQLFSKKPAPSRGNDLSTPAEGAPFVANPMLRNPTRKGNESSAVSTDTRLRQPSSTQAPSKAASQLPNSPDDVVMNLSDPADTPTPQE
jgi:hypothetical protein